MRVSTVLLVALLVLGATAASRAQSDAGFQLVVNRSNGVSSLPRARVSEMLKKRVAKWENGVKVDLGSRRVTFPRAWRYT